MSEPSRLEEISIRGIGVIDEASIQLQPGLTVFTGETGAGKTMVLTALSLVLGGKADASLVRQGKERLIASATFSVDDSRAREVLERGGAVDENQLILTRVVSADGKSKATAGGISVPMATLSGLAENLVEIHAQAANLSITKSAKQREILDRFGGEELARSLEHFQRLYQDFLDLKKRLTSLKENARGRDAEIRELVEFSENFRKVNPVPGEWTELVQEISRLSSIDVLQQAAGEASALLDDELTGALTTLGQARRAMESVQGKDELIGQILSNVSEGYFILNDAAQDLHRYISNLEMDPLKLEWALSRKQELTTFLKRFADVEEPDTQIARLIERFAKAEEDIEDLSGGEDRIAALEMELNQSWREVSLAAHELSAVRKKFANYLANSATEEIQSLAMPHTRLICEVTAPDFGSALAESQVTHFGVNEVSLLLQPHKDGPLVPLAKGASGGEMSRVMLALEVVLARSQPVGTYIFDEVDAGVGGKAAIEVGRRLHQLSRHAQVIVVTHLPQVAAWADSHFVLQKNSDGTISQSDVKEVKDGARVEEIARMLAGHEDSRSAQEHASELLSMRA